MGSHNVLGADILDWRKINLSKGGRPVDLDWLLDIGAGLRWSDLQMICLYPEKSCSLQKSLIELEKIWQLHLTTHKPLQQIIGKCPWRDFTLEVNSDVLIPRQESELLVDLALSKFNSSLKGAWADLGTGSGAIAIGLAKSLPDWQGHLVDCSERAIALAKKNFKNLCPFGKATFYLGDWMEPLIKYRNSINLIVSNPPYIPKAVLRELHPTVRNHEPLLALCGGEDGLDSCRKLISGAFEGLCGGGWLIIEHHHDQSDKVLEILDANGYKNVSYKKDLQGIRRFAMGSHS